MSLSAAAEGNLAFARRPATETLNDRTRGKAFRRPHLSPATSRADVSNLTALRRLRQRMTNPDQVHRLHAHDHIAVLVQHLEQGAQQAAIGLGV
jgi:hypothetical protein